MEDSSKMLSQEEIDSMLTKTASRPRPATKIATEAMLPAATEFPPGPLSNMKKVSVANINPKDAPQTNRGGHQEECIAAGDINSLKQQVSEIVHRLSLLETTVSRIENETSKPGGQTNPAALKAAIQQVQNVSSQVEIISEGLRGTAGYNISKVFTCGSCGSVGVVAIKVKCTKCGEENWWGWWPKKK
jgi:hypothetical protein